MKYIEYKTIIFDCDGVILNSNKIKSNSFYEVTCEFGVDLAKKFEKYHKINGGVSRFKKFQYFIDEILPKNSIKPSIEYLLEKYSSNIFKKLLECEINSDIRNLYKNSCEDNWMVISGSKQSELIQIFKQRNISHFFKKGIFGSPNSKIEIFNREISNKNILRPAIYLGDSQYDFEVAKRFNIDFLFVSDWTEFSEYQHYCLQNKIKIIPSIIDFFVNEN